MSVLSTLAQASSNFGDFSSDYSYTTTTTEVDPAAAAAGMGILLFVLLFALVAYLFFSFCMMKIFKKAGRKDAWAAFVPIYNMYVFYEVAGRPGWWAFLGFIPFVGGIAALVTQIIGSLDMAKSFGKSSGFGVVLALLPFIGYPMLAFGDASYQGPAGPEGNKQQPQAPQAPTQPPVQPTV